jgi:hypothetical protein
MLDMIDTWHCTKATDVPIFLFLADFPLRVDLSVYEGRRCEN